MIDLFYDLQALVAEVNLNGKASMRSDGMTQAEIHLVDMSVYTTSLRIEQTHLKLQVLIIAKYLKYSQVRQPQIVVYYKAISKPSCMCGIQAVPIDRICCPVPWSVCILE